MLPRLYPKICIRYTSRRTKASNTGRKGTQRETENDRQMDLESGAQGAYFALFTQFLLQKRRFVFVISKKPTLESRLGYVNRFLNECSHWPVEQLSRTFWRMFPLIGQLNKGSILANQNLRLSNVIRVLIVKEISWAQLIEQARRSEAETVKPTRKGLRIYCLSSLNICATTTEAVER